MYIFTIFSSYIYISEKYLDSRKLIVERRLMISQKTRKLIPTEPSGITAIK